ncbi:MAG TPA: insulinase family protein, partial [Caldilineaceae bacterium]|nr:insulinase family protein [Caldilineaceae bacterium]
NKNNHLAQEGWHYELASPDGPLIYKGVVFNEMKGAYSSPDSLLFRFGKQALFPDNAYRHDSGGDPREIPNLTYEQFRAFHATYYHPSNALVYFYGDDDPEQRLKLLDEQLRAFHAINVDSAVPLQRPFAQPTQSAFTYAADAETDLHNKNYIQLSWLLPENEDRSLVMGLSALSYAILGTPASPLRKALTESGLGEDVTGGGLGTYLRQMVFSVGMKGVAVDKLTAVETLILETLTTLATDGIEAATIEAAVNTIEFNLRENNTGSYPRGLSLMLRALSTWAYGRDPLMPLRYEEPLAELKETLAENPAYFQQLIQTYLLDNAHRNTVTLHPDGDLAQQMRAAEEEQLAQVYATLDEPKRQAIIEQATELQRIHEAPDDPAALAALPMLTLGDLEKEVKTIPLLLEHAHGAEILFHDLFTNGILYLNVGFDLKTVPHHLLPYLHLFGRALLEMGTATEDYVQLQQRIGAKTGGIWHSTLVAPQANSSETTAKFFLSGKATVAQSPELFAIMQDMLCGVALDNRDRFRQIVLKAKARNEAALVPSGHSVVADRIRAAFNTAYWIEEETGGVNYLFFLRKLIQRIDEDWPSVLQELEQLRSLLIRRDGLLINATLDGTNWQQLQPALQQFITALPSATPAGVQWAPTFVMSNEGLIIPAQVNYVGKATNLYDAGYTYHGSVNVISNFVRTSWLWDKIRMQGGAYGAFCRFGKQSGVLTFLSYRDPNLLQTLAVYDQTVAVLRAVDLNAQELTRNIIGAISAMDSYQLPDAKGYTSMVRHLMQESDEMRQQTRDEVLGTTLADFHNFADVVATALPAARVVVMGSQQALSAANAERPDWLQLQKVM